VAREAGVSPAVVSYVLNDSNYVSAEKREAVLQAVKALGYHPNAVARSLKKKSLRQIIFLVDDLRNEIFNIVGYYLEMYAYERGYYVSMASCTRQKALGFIDLCCSRQFDGIILGSNVYNEKDMDRIVEKGIPLVLYQTRYYRHLSEKISVINSSLDVGMEEAMDHLIVERGHRNIGYIVSPGVPTSQEERGEYGDGMRVNGYINGLKKHNIPVRSDFLYTLEPRTFEPRTFMRPDGTVGVQKPYVLLTEENLRAMANGVKEDRITAFVASTDRTAAKAIVMLRSIGLRIPEDVEIVGIGGSETAEMSQPMITTIKLDKQEIAHLAVDMMIDRIEGKPARSSSIKVELVKRQSTGCEAPGLGEA
jgi:DNA-binding LacI/PurR family transcriptional regulator